MPDRPLLMIPGPVALSPAVIAAAAAPPRSHVSKDFIATMGRSLGLMRSVWEAGQDAQPFVVAGSGTLAMEMAVQNLVDPGDPVLVVGTGYFSDRMAEMLRRRGAEVTSLAAPLGDAPELDDVAHALDHAAPKAMFATHVDTSTGVRVDAEGLCRLARDRDVLSVFDGVCAIGGERFPMEAWGADVSLTASQKALGLPPGLALLVTSQRALEARRRLGVPPPLSLDWIEWLPIMAAYEAGRASYFATPATSLVTALQVGLEEVLDGIAGPGLDMRLAAHAKAARAFRAAFASWGLDLVPVREGLAANTLTAARYPTGVGPELLPVIAGRGVIVAGGLHPSIQATYFRVGHMGSIVDRPAELSFALDAIGGALRACGHDADIEAGMAAASALLTPPSDPESPS